MAKRPAFMDLLNFLLFYLISVNTENYRAKRNDLAYNSADWEREAVINKPARRAYKEWKSRRSGTSVSHTEGGSIHTDDRKKLDYKITEGCRRAENGEGKHVRRTEYQAEEDRPQNIPCAKFISVWKHDCSHNRSYIENSANVCSEH